MEVHFDHEKVQQEIGQTGGADLVIGIVADIDQTGIEILVGALRNFPGTPGIVVLQKERSTTLAATAAEGNDKDAAKDASLGVLP